MAKVALLIGVSEYEEGLAPLPSAVKDIEELQRVLQHPEMGGFDEVKTLANPEAHIMQRQIETLFDDRSKEDLVLFFFSGHGIKDDAGKLYFASRGTRKNVKGELVRSTAVPTSFVHEIMNNSRAKRQAIILDCCFSGAFDPSLQSKDDGSVDLQTQLGAEGRVVLTSSSSTQYSFSPTEAQGSDLSIYTRYLVEGIETGAGDINSDGFVSMLELHEYAAGKVRETAPKMTPKIIVLKDKGFEIILSKARVTDPKLRYRKAASKYANAGAIRPAGRAVLNTLRQQLGITIENATEIENEVLRPYQERLANLQQYREALIASAEHEYPLNQLDREDLDMLQQMLGLGDEDVLLIQQEVEAQFVGQSSSYQQNLAQYELALTEAIEREFPFSQQDLQGLESLRQSLGLRNEDVTIIKQPLIQQAESRYEENLRQKSELKRQEQEKVEYGNKLQRYEQEFIKAIQADYPLSHFVLGGLKSFQQQLGLKDEDVSRIEQPIRQLIEARYQEKLRQQEQVEQQQQRELEERRKAEQEKLRQAQEKADYENKLERYEQELFKAVQIEYPLSTLAQASLNHFRDLLGLSEKDTVAINQRILRNAEAKYQSKIEAESARQKIAKDQAESLPPTIRIKDGGTSSILAIQLGVSHLTASIILDGQARVLSNSQGVYRYPINLDFNENGCFSATQKEILVKGFLKLIGDLSKKDLKNINCSDEEHFTDDDVIDADFTDDVIDADFTEGVIDADFTDNINKHKVLISVPSHFTIPHRLVIKEAAKIAGLECLRISNSTSLAAIGFDYDSTENKTILIIDIDDGYIVNSILETGDGVFEVMSVSGIFCFQQWTSEFLGSLEQVVRDAIIDKSKVDKVVITGKSSYIEKVKLLVNEKFNKQISVIHSEPLVALGAAIEAGILDGIVKDILLLDVSPWSVGVETLGGKMTVIIPKNTTIPTKKSEVFSTAVDGQSNVEIHVLEGEKEYVKDNTSLGTFRLDGIPPLPKGTPQIEVIFYYDTNTGLTVSAVEKQTRKELVVTIQLDPNDSDFHENLEIAQKEQNKRKKFLGLF